MVYKLTLVPEHGYIFLLIPLIGVLKFYLDYCVMKARSKYNVHPPTLYLPESHKNAKEYNCVQRSHQNIVTERVPMFFVTLFVASIFNPKLAAACGAVRLMSFFFYAVGYQTGKPEKRVNPLALTGYIADFGLLYLCATTGFRLLET